MSEHSQQRSTWLAARAADVSATDLWMHYFEIGGNLAIFEIDAYLNCAYQLPIQERNMIALALNELIDDLPHRPKAEFVDIALKTDWSTPSNQNW